MFRRAVSKHSAAYPASQVRNLGGLAATDTNNRDILKPSPENQINKTHAPIFSVEKNPLKRTASQIQASPEPMRTPLSKAASTGVLNQLHDDVFFDENDFDETIDLDEDPMLPIKYPKLPADSFDSVDGTSQQAVTYPELPQISVSQTDHTPHRNKSSAPLAWSSSPVSHKLPPTNASILKREGMDPALSRSVHEPVPQPKKRRNLPWSKSEEEIVKTPQSETKPTKTPSRPNQAPWTTTASAIKQQQSDLRQKNAKSRKVAVKQIDDDTTKPLIKGKKGKRKMARVFLSDEQKMVLDLVTEKKESVFFTGSAGTGKSVLMREIIKALRIKYAKEPDRVAVTASTGLAACHISGVTLHSFAGIGLGREPAEDLIKKIKKNAKARNRWLRAKVLIIDEISMVDGKLFDKLEKVARGLRNDGRPFGGIQLVVTGDFFQLPPVPDGGREATFAFDAATWRTVLNHTIGLTHVFRQKDPVFAGMLNEMRVGKLSQPSINAFHKLHRQLDAHDSIEATELFPTRDEVDRSNRTRMQQLEGRAFVFTSTDGGSIQDTAQRIKLLNNCMAPHEITLKKGAQVMLIKNLDDGLVNGSIGRVIAFMDEQTYDLYLEDDSTVQPPDLLNISDMTVLKSKLKIQEYAAKDTATASSNKAWPLVSFQLHDGTTRQLLCVNEKWTIELPNGEVQASRAQVPLILAWALSIHKAQGQTLDRVKVDLGKVFEKGQAYVALSRATSQEGLQVLNFNPKKVMAHDKVRRFYESLSTTQEPKPALKASTSPGTAQDWMGDGLDEDRRLLDYANYA